MRTLLVIVLIGIAAYIFWPKQEFLRPRLPTPPFREVEAVYKKLSPRVLSPLGDKVPANIEEQIVSARVAITSYLASHPTATEKCAPALALCDGMSDALKARAAFLQKQAAVRGKVFQPVLVRDETERQSLYAQRIAVAEKPVLQMWGTQVNNYKTSLRTLYEKMKISQATWGDQQGAAASP
jgi:hypothetical protein